MPDGSRSRWEAHSDTPTAGKVLALVVVVAAVAYANSFHGALVLDDYSSIQENTSIRHVWPLGPVFNPPETAGVGGRPIANLTYALNYAISGLDVWSYHALNLALHIGSALLLFGIIRRTLRHSARRSPLGREATAIAGASALLWVVHPLATATVDYLSQRTEALMAFCYLGTLYGFVRGAAWGEREPPKSTDAVAAPSRPLTGWLVLSVAMCALGTTCKEVIVTAPVLVVAYDRVFVSGSWQQLWRRHGGFHLALAGTWLLLAWLMLRAPVTDRGVGFGLGLEPGLYLANEARALAIYARDAVWPHPLVFDWGWNYLPHIRAALPYLAACLVAAAGTLWLLRRTPRVGLIALAPFLILAPTTVVPVVHQPIAESRPYLPLAAGCILAALVGFVALGRRAWTVIALVVLAGMLLTMRRNRDYMTAVALWGDTVAKVPASARAHNNYAVVLLADHRLDEALAHTATALALEPKYVDAHITRASTFAALGRLHDTVAEYKAALHADPQNVTAHANLGNALVALGDNAAARAHLETALAHDPNLARTHNDLGVVLLDTGDVAGAIRHDEAALRLDPRMADAHYNLGNALAAAGKPTEAVAEYRAALALKPAFDKAENNLGAVLLKLGRPDEARTHFEAAVRLNPDSQSARRNLEIVTRPPLHP